MLHLHDLLDDAKCFATIRQMRWPDGVTCPLCGSSLVHRRGKNGTQPARQRYKCDACQREFDDLTHTIFAGHHQPLKLWILCLYLMGLNLSNEQIAQELELNKDDVHKMTLLLRQGIVDKTPTPQLCQTVECDEVYVVAGHKGHPEAVKKGGVLAGEGVSKERVDAAP